MSEPSPARPARQESPAPLAEALSMLEGRYAPDELAGRVVRAAMSLPGVVRADGGHEFLSEGGLVAGLLPDVSYSSGEVRLGTGDVLVEDDRVLLVMNAT